MSGGGGGTSGEVGFPNYVETIHHEVLFGTQNTINTGVKQVDAAIAEAHTGDPYSGAAAVSTEHLRQTIDTWFREVKSQVDQLDNLSDMTDALDQAVTDVLGNAGTQLEEVDNSGIGSTFNKPNAGNITGDLDPEANLEDKVMSRLGAVVSDAESRDAGIDPEKEWSSSIQKVIQQQSVVDEVAPQDVVGDATNKASSEINAAISTALDAVNQEVVEDLVNEFQQRVNDRLVGRKRRLSSVFADANAVHSSAFVIGHALLERDAQREVNRFDAEVSQQLFQEAIGQHLQAFSQSLQVEAEVRLQNAANKLQFIQQGSQIIAELISQRTGKESTLIQSYLEAFSTRLEAYLQAEFRNKELDVQSEQVEASIGELEARESEAEVQKAQVDLQNKSAEDQLVSQAMQAMYQGRLRNLELLLSERRARQQVAATDWEARQSAEEYEVKLDQKSQLWDLQVLKEGGNILAAPSGMAATLPEEPSDASKAVGGALTGAAAGAKTGAAIGSSGGPIGAGGGALIGAGLGIASGFL